jgi:hypothetical protein
MQEKGRPPAPGKLLTAGVLGGLLICATILVVREFQPPRPATYDTRLRSGTHVVFVFIAPTGGEDTEYQESVARAKRAVRLEARTGGYYYSTVGISVDWIVPTGMGILARFGPFDEVVVGRNWLNTGIKRYVHELAGEAVVPQVLVMLEGVKVDTLPFRYDEPLEVLRVIGRDGMHAWAAAGFPIAFPPAFDTITRVTANAQTKADKRAR